MLSAAGNKQNKFSIDKLLIDRESKCPVQILTPARTGKDSPQTGKRRQHETNCGPAKLVKYSLGLAHIDELKHTTMAKIEELLQIIE